MIHWPWLLVVVVPAFVLGYFVSAAMAVFSRSSLRELDGLLCGGDWEG